MSTIMINRTRSAPLVLPMLAAVLATCGRTSMNAYDAGDGGGIGRDAGVGGGRDAGVLRDGGRVDTSTGGKGEGTAGAAGNTGAGGSGGAGSGGAVGLGGATASAGASGATGTGPSVWRQSQSPFCLKTSDYPVFVKVWSDRRGVFALVSDGAAPMVWSNTGSAWQLMYTWPAQTWMGSGGLRGFVDGPLLVFGGLRCGIELVDQSGASCSSGAPTIYDVAVVSSKLAYAVYGKRVLRFDGNLWTQLGSPLPTTTRAVWADASDVAIAADVGGVYLIHADQDPVLAVGLPEGDHTAVWGFAANDLWAGNSDGQVYHYDGQRWTYQFAADGPILKLWGSAGVLFLLTSTSFGRWDRGRMTVLDVSDGGDVSYFQDLWGNSPFEVFVSLVDRNAITSQCGPLKLRWFDGSAMHPL
jgi:hypothetical protein